MYDDNWCVYTTNRNEANLYRFEDRSPNRWAKKSWQMYTKRVNLYYYDKQKKRYYLPPKIRNASKLKNKIWKSIEVKPIMQLREWQQKTIEYCKELFLNWIPTVLVDSQVWTWKTIQMLWLINATKYNTLIIVPSEAIGLGIQEKLSQYCDAQYLNGAKIRKVYPNLPDVLITHRQSAVNTRALINWHYKMLLNDEQHHLSDGMKMICNTWKWSIIVWFTGTPYRKEMEKEDFKKYFHKIYDTGLESLPVKVLTYKYKHNYTMQDYLKACEWFDPESPEVSRRLINANEDRLKHIKKIVSKLYFDYWFKRLILFVDRREYQDKLKTDVFHNAILINGDTDKEKVINELKDKDEYLIIGMVTATWEGFDVPAIQCWILFYSTSRAWSLTQMIWRAKRFHGEKQYAYWVDFQDYAMIPPKLYKSFWAKARKEFYIQQWFEVNVLR